MQITFIPSSFGESILGAANAQAVLSILGIGGSSANAPISASSLSVGGSASIGSTLSFSAGAGAAGSVNRIDLIAGTYGFGISPSSVDYVSGVNHTFYRGSQIVAKIGSELAFYGPTGGQGYVALEPGTASYPGYLAFFTADGTRRGYIGYSGSNNQLQLQAENNWTWQVASPLTCTSTLTVAGNATFSAGVTLPYGQIGNTVQGGLYIDSANVAIRSVSANGTGSVFIQAVGGTATMATFAPAAISLNASTTVAGSATINGTVTVGGTATFNGNSISVLATGGWTGNAVARTYLGDANGYVENSLSLAGTRLAGYNKVDLYLTSTNSIGATVNNSGMTVTNGLTVGGGITANGASINGILRVYDSGTATFNAGIATEVSSTLIDYGINNSRFGTMSSASQGGFLRFDTRSGQSLVQIIGSAVGASTASTIGTIDNVGNAYFAGTITLGGLKNYASDSAAASGGVAINQFYRNGSQLLVRIA